MRSSKYFGMKNEQSSKASLNNFDKCFKNTLLKMLGLSNTLSLWNLKQKGQQEASNAVAAQSPEGSNTAKDSCPPSLSNFIHLAKLTQMAQLAQIKEQQRVAQVQASVQAAHAQAQAQ